MIELVISNIISYEMMKKISDSLLVAYFLANTVVIEMMKKQFDAVKTGTDTGTDTGTETGTESGTNFLLGSSTVGCPTTQLEEYETYGHTKMGFDLKPILDNQMSPSHFGFVDASAHM